MRIACFNCLPTVLLLSIASFSSGVIAVDEDSANLFERGILNWLHYQKIIRSDNVYKIEIDNAGFKSANLTVLSLKSILVIPSVMILNHQSSNPANVGPWIY
jgi:hypothetical protein